MPQLSPPDRRAVRSRVGRGPARLSRAVAVARRPDEARVLARLWDLQRAHAAARGESGPGMDYLAAHFAMPLTLERHLRVVDQMFPFVRGRVLEWGCRHALDSCVYRMRLGDRVELHGCDVDDGEVYRPFHDFSGLKYFRITHPYRLEYEDESFDAVTSNGVLEHVPDDEASLAELYRVLKPGGTLVVTCLPNRYSYTEALQRWRGRVAHDRLYSLSQTRRMLSRHGFETTESGRFLMVPTMLNGFGPRAREVYQQADRLVWGANAVLERAWPLSVLASNLMFVARKPGPGAPRPVPAAG